MYKLDVSQLSKNGADTLLKLASVSAISSPDTWENILRTRSRRAREHWLNRGRKMVLTKLPTQPKCPSSLNRTGWLLYISVFLQFQAACFACVFIIFFLKLLVAVSGGASIWSHMCLFQNPMYSVTSRCPWYLLIFWIPSLPSVTHFLKTRSRAIANHGREGRERRKGRRVCAHWELTRHRLPPMVERTEHPEKASSFFCCCCSVQTTTKITTTKIYLGANLY